MVADQTPWDRPARAFEEWSPVSAPAWQFGELEAARSPTQGQLRVAEAPRLPCLKVRGEILGPAVHWVSFGSPEVRDAWHSTRLGLGPTGPAMAPTSPGAARSRPGRPFAASPTPRGDPGSP